MDEQLDISYLQRLNQQELREQLMQVNEFLQRTNDFSSSNIFPDNQQDFTTAFGPTPSTPNTDILNNASKFSNNNGDTELNNVSSRFMNSPTIPPQPQKQQDFADRVQNYNNNLIMEKYLSQIKNL